MIKNSKKNQISESEDKSFSFSKENLKKAQQIIDSYPLGKERSAVMPLLQLAQEQNNNWISREIVDYIAKILKIEPLQVQEVLSFYTMFNQKPVGKFLVQICRTTPCWLCGSDDITQACKEELGIDMGETTSDNLFTLVEVECLGACIKGPVIQINNDYYENLNKKSTISLLRKLKKSQD